LSDQARDRVIAAARALADEGGYQGVQMREVARRAGISLDTLYRFYQSKDQVLRAVVRAEIRALRDTIDEQPVEGDTPHDRTAAFFVLAFRSLQEHRGYAHAAMQSYEAPFPFDPVPPTPPDGPGPSGFVDVAAYAVWGPDHAPSEEEHIALLAIEGVFTSSVIAWLNGIISAAYAERRITTAARHLVLPLSEPAPDTPATPAPTDELATLLADLLRAAPADLRRRLAAHLLPDERPDQHPVEGAPTRG